MRIVALAILFVVAVSAQASNSQPVSTTSNSIAGTWYGSVEGFTGEPRRILTVTGAAGKEFCTWDEVGKDNGRAVQCLVGRGQIDLTTAANSIVTLSHDGGMLRGTFTLKSGKVFSITMGLTPFDMTQTGSEKQVLEHCERPVSYSIAVPATDVPDNVRAFSGVWVGKWNTGECSALAVERLDAAGNAKILYVWGSWSTPWRTQQSGSRSQNAKIAENKLDASTNDVWIEYVMQSPSVLNMTSSRRTLKSVNDAGVFVGTVTRK